MTVGVAGMTLYTRHRGLNRYAGAHIAGTCATNQQGHSYDLDKAIEALRDQYE